VVNLDIVLSLLWSRVFTPPRRTYAGLTHYVTIKPESAYNYICVYTQQDATYRNKKKFVKSFLCLINYALLHEGVWVSGCIDPRFLYLVISWRAVVNFMSLPLYPRGRSLQCLLDWRVGGLQSRSQQYGEVKVLNPTWTLNSDPSVFLPAARLRYRDSYCTSIKISIYNWLSYVFVF
jgi:hypothetical protein